MDGGTDKVRSWLFRFRLRTLLLIPLLLAVYLALGGPTKTLGVRDVSERLTRENNGRVITAEYFAPLVLKLPVISVRSEPGKPHQLITKTDYYFWLFGLTAKVPYRFEYSKELPASATNSPTN